MAELCNSTKIHTSNSFTSTRGTNPISVSIKKNADVRSSMRAIWPYL